MSVNNLGSTKKKTIFEIEVTRCVVSNDAWMEKVYNKIKKKHCTEWRIEF